MIDRIAHARRLRGQKVSWLTVDANGSVAPGTGSIPTTGATPGMFGWTRVDLSIGIGCGSTPIPNPLAGVVWMIGLPAPLDPTVMAPLVIVYSREHQPPDPSSSDRQVVHAAR